LDKQHEQHENLVGLNAMDLKPYDFKLIANEELRKLAITVNEPMVSLGLHRQRRTFDPELEERLRREVEGDNTTLSVPYESNDAVPVNPPSSNEPENSQEQEDDNTYELPKPLSSSEKDNPQDFIESGSAQESNESSAPQESNESSAPQESNESSAPQESNESSAPQESNESSAPQESNEESSAPQESNESSAPQESNESSAPQESNESNDVEESEENTDNSSPPLDNDKNNKNKPGPTPPFLKTQF